MPTRREFLEKTTVMLLMIPVAAACTSNNATPSPTIPIEGGCAIQVIGVAVDDESGKAATVHGGSSGSGAGR